MSQIQVQQSKCHLLADDIAVRIRRFFWMRGESPRLTFPWNHRPLTQDEIKGLDQGMMVSVEGIRGESSFPGPLFPRCGGWRNFIVIEPFNGLMSTFYVGWIYESTEGLRGEISSVRVSTHVRGLKGPGPVKFFLIDAETGNQIATRSTGTGYLGDKGPFTDTSLI